MNPTQYPSPDQFLKTIDRIFAELAEAHKACDGFAVADKTLENGNVRPLSLPERIQVLRRAIADYQRWMEQAERLVGHPLPVTDEDEVRLGSRRHEHGWASCAERMPTREDSDKWGMIVQCALDGTLFLACWDAPNKSLPWLLVSPLPEPETVDPFERWWQSPASAIVQICRPNGVNAKGYKDAMNDAWDAALASVSQQQAHDLP